MERCALGREVLVCRRRYHNEARGKRCKRKSVSEIRRKGISEDSGDITRCDPVGGEVSDFAGAQMEWKET